MVKTTTHSFLWWNVFFFFFLYFLLASFYHCSFHKIKNSWNSTPYMHHIISFLVHFLYNLTVIRCVLFLDQYLLNTTYLTSIIFNTKITKTVNAQYINDIFVVTQSYDDINKLKQSLKENSVLIFQILFSLTYSTTPTAII